MTMQMIDVVNVLGTPYTVTKKNMVEEPELEQCDGFCDHTTKSIVISDIIERPGSVEDLDTYTKGVIRHELVHAFLFESGLGSESWGKDEEIVDWIAQQFPKMLEAFKGIDAI